jgi:hypothetical protein
MNPQIKKSLFIEAMESALSECREQIRRAVLQYEKEIDSALRELRQDLVEPDATVH